MPLIIGLYMTDIYGTNYWIVCDGVYATNDWVVCADLYATNYWIV